MNELYITMGLLTTAATLYGCYWGVASMPSPETKEPAPKQPKRKEAHEVVEVDLEEVSRKEAAELLKHHRERTKVYEGLLKQGDVIEF